jgi:membrane-associated phospholipid phosphatase
VVLLFWLELRLEVAAAAAAAAGLLECLRLLLMLSAIGVVLLDLVLLCLTLGSLVGGSRLL